MNKLLWVFHVVLTLTFALFGGQKLVMSIPDLIAQGMLWIEDFPVWQVRLIGALEVLGVIGLNAPYLLRWLPRWLVPLAAGGLALTMVGAVATHIVRVDPAPSIVITSLLFVMAATLSASRFGALRETHGSPDLAPRPG